MQVFFTYEQYVNSRIILSEQRCGKEWGVLIYFVYTSKTLLYDSRQLFNKKYNTRVLCPSFRRNRVTILCMYRFTKFSVTRLVVWFQFIFNSQIIVLTSDWLVWHACTEFRLIYCILTNNIVTETRLFFNL